MSECEFFKASKLYIYIYLYTIRIILYNFNGNIRRSIAQHSISKENRRY